MVCLPVLSKGLGHDAAAIAASLISSVDALQAKHWIDVTCANDGNLGDVV